MQVDNDSIIKEELELIKEDILKIYNASTKRTSGEFEQGLELAFNPNKGTLSGYVYLAGRAAGKMPPIDAIKKWIEDKGIAPIEAKLSVSSLAYLIARKIAREGTDKENHLYIYNEVITPERIDKIFERLDKINVQAFINDVTIMIKKLVTAA